MNDIGSKVHDRVAWDAGALAADFELLPRIGLLEAVRRYWYLVLLPVLVFVPVAIIVAAVRTPKYTAESRLVVGRLNVSTPGAVQGYSQTAIDLASTYPLVVPAYGVIDPVARALHIPAGQVRSDVTSSEVPDSAIVRIDATAHSAGIAIALANAVSHSLVAYLQKLNAQDPDVALVGAQLSAAELKLARAQAALPVPQGTSLETTIQQTAAAQTAQAEVNALSQYYTLTVENEAPSPLIQPVAFAASASSDRTSKLELAVVAAAAAGLFIGLALALLQANLAVRKALTLPRWEPTVASDLSTAGDDGEPHATQRVGSDHGPETPPQRRRVRPRG